jgi:hypothetical protein
MQLRSAASLLALALSLAAQTQSASAQAAPFTINLQFPITISVFVPCALGGAGEVVDLSGMLHELFHVVSTPGGRLQLKLHDQPQGISGTGETSGEKYQATGVTQQLSNTNTFTFVNNFRIIGQGPDNNFLVHELFHVTVNANGEITAFVDGTSVECR